MPVGSTFTRAKTGEAGASHVLCGEEQAMKKKALLVALTMTGTLISGSCVGNTLIWLFGGFF